MFLALLRKKPVLWIRLPALSGWRGVIGRRTVPAEKGRGHQVDPHVVHFAERIVASSSSGEEL